MSSLHLLSNATLVASEGAHHVNEELLSMAPVFGIVAFVLFVVSLLAAMSFSSRGKAPVVGEYHDPSQLPADEQAMLDSAGPPGVNPTSAPVVTAERDLPIPPRIPGRTRLGVMGGTFDPIHHGHLVAASEVAAVFDLDEVVFVPTGEPWQKAGQDVTDAEHRYLMTVVATASNPRCPVSRVDVDRHGPTYTIDTLRDLHAQRPDAELFFITGADAMAEILTWKGAEELWRLARFVGVTRPGHVRSAPAGSVAAGKPVWYLVPDGVVQYINKYGLYCSGTAPSSTSGHASASDAGPVADTSPCGAPDAAPSRSAPTDPPGPSRPGQRSPS